MKIQLINPPVSSNFSRPSRAGCFPPLDLLSIASYLIERNRNWEIDILDGEIVSLEDILSNIDADIVGISPKVFSYETSLEIANICHEKGARVIFGGVWASSVSEKILKKRPYVDFVVIGDGEATLCDIINSKPYDQIPGLVYRKKKDIITNKQKYVEINSLPFIDYRKTNLYKYFENYRNRFEDHLFKRPLSIYSQKGCNWYDKSGGCIFCRKQYSINRRKTPSRYWDEIQYLEKHYKVDLIWDVSDTFTEPEEWVKELVKKKPSDIVSKFYLYGRVSDINEKMVLLLNKIKCIELLIGVESGCDRLLRNANKGSSKEFVLNAVKICANNGIQIFPTFLLGLPGENTDSLEETFSMAQEMMKYGNIKEVSTAILTPLPGSKIYEMLCKRLGNPYWLIDNDYPDLLKIQNKYVVEFTRTSIDDLMYTNRRISSLVEKNKQSSFGNFRTYK